MPGEQLVAIRGGKCLQPIQEATGDQVHRVGNGDLALAPGEELLVVRQLYPAIRPQIINTVPTESHDVRMNVVVTD